MKIEPIRRDAYRSKEAILKHTGAAKWGMSEECYRPSALGHADWLHAKELELVERTEGYLDAAP